MGRAEGTLSSLVKTESIKHWTWNIRLEIFTLGISLSTGGCTAGNSHTIQTGDNYFLICFSKQLNEFLPNTGITQRHLQLLAWVCLQLPGLCRRREDTLPPWQKIWGHAKRECERIHSASGQHWEHLWDSGIRQLWQTGMAILHSCPKSCSLMHREFMVEIQEKKLQWYIAIN